MMHGGEKSGPVIVASRPPNKPARAGAEAEEPRAGAEGNAGQHDTHRALNRERVTQALDRVRQAANQRFAVSHPRWEPYAGKPPVRLCAGGA